jgi:hypothetical protein
MPRPNKGLRTRAMIAPRNFVDLCRGAGKDEGKATILPWKAPLAVSEVALRVRE